MQDPFIPNALLSVDTKYDCWDLMCSFPFFDQCKWGLISWKNHSFKQLQFHWKHFIKEQKELKWIRNLRNMVGTAEENTAANQQKKHHNDLFYFCGFCFSELNNLHIINTPTSGLKLHSCSHRQHPTMKSHKLVFRIALNKLHSSSSSDWTAL